MATWVLRTDNGTDCCPESVDGGITGAPDTFTACECACNDDTRWADAQASFTSEFTARGFTVVGPGWTGISEFSFAYLEYGLVYLLARAPAAGCMPNPGSPTNCHDYTEMEWRATFRSAYSISIFGSCTVQGALYGPNSDLPCECGGCLEPVPDGANCFDSPWSCLSGYYWYYAQFCNGPYTSSGYIRAGCVEGCDASPPSDPYITDYASFRRGTDYTFTVEWPPDGGCNSAATELYLGVPQGSEWLVAYRMS